MYDYSIRHLRLAAAWAAAAAALFVLYPRRYLGYDEAWANVWGRQIAHGQIPTYRHAFAPTPHPLANLVGAALDLIGADSATTTLVLTMLAFAALILAVSALGWRLFGWPVGLVALVVLATRSSLVREAEYGSTDIWFLALVTGAGLSLAMRPQRPYRVFVWLALAGLLRPEAWLLSGAYLVYVCWGQPWRAWRAPAMLAASAPLLWALSDLAITGDPLYSLHGTAALAAALDRPRSETVALVALPKYLRFLVGDQVAALGIIGAIAGIIWLYRPSLMLLAVGLLGALTFLALGLLGLPLLDRYLLVPAIVLAVFCGVAVAGWWRIEDRRLRLAWLVAAAGAVALLATGAASDRRALADVNLFTGARAAVQNELYRTLALPAVRAGARCGPVFVPDYRAVPIVSRRLMIPPGRVRIGSLRPGARGVRLAYASPLALNLFAVTGHETFAPALPPRARRVHDGDYWIADVACP
jgi:hypothetical protein